MPDSEALSAIDYVCHLVPCVVWSVGLAFSGKPLWHKAENDKKFSAFPFVVNSITLAMTLYSFAVGQRA